MKTRVLFLLVFLLFAATSGGWAEATSGTGKVHEIHRKTEKEPLKKPHKESLQDILSGADPLDPVSEKSIQIHFRQDLQDLQSWWKREADAILWLMIGSGLVLLGVFIGILLIRRAKKRISEHKVANWHTELFAALSEPVLILLGLFGIFSFLVPVLRSVPEFYTCNVRFFFTLITLCIAWGGMEFITVLSRKMADYAEKDTNNLDALMVDITRKILKILLILITIFFIGQSIFNLNITTLLTGAGVVGLAVAFASKETLSNFFGTMVIIGDKPFRCGDRVQINGIDGIVASVGMRSTRIHTPNETVYMIPNSQIESASIENISYRGVIRFVFTVGLVYETPEADIRKAIEILHELLDHFHGKDADRYKPHIFFDNLGNSGMNIRVIMWLKTSSFSQEEAWRTEINLAIVKRFNENGISMAYNTTTNYLYGDPNHPLYMEYNGKHPEPEKETLILPSQNTSKS